MENPGYGKADPDGERTKIFAKFFRNFQVSGNLEPIRYFVKAGAVLVFIQLIQFLCYFRNLLTFCG